MILCNESQNQSQGRSCIRSTCVFICPPRLSRGTFVKKNWVYHASKTRFRGRGSSVRLTEFFSLWDSGILASPVSLADGQGQVNYQHTFGKMVLKELGKSWSPSASRKSCDERLRCSWLLELYWVLQRIPYVYLETRAVTAWSIK